MKLHLVLLSNEPQRVYPALTFALAAATMGDEANLYVTMDGLDLVRPDRRESIRLEGMPPVDRYLQDALAAGVRIYACGPSKEMLAEMGLTQESLEEGIQLEDVTGFLLNLKPVGPDTLLSFI